LTRRVNRSRLFQQAPIKGCHAWVKNPEEARSLNNTALNSIIEKSKVIRVMTSKLLSDIPKHKRVLKEVIEDGSAKTFVYESLEEETKSASNRLAGLKQ